MEQRHQLTIEMVLFFLLQDMQMIDEILQMTPKQSLCRSTVYDMKFLKVSFGDSLCSHALVKLNLAIRGFASYGGCSQYMPVHSNS